MADNKNKNVFDRLWDLMASVKLAIVVFALISLTSIVGTVIEQNVSPQTNLKILQELVGNSLAPTVYNILDAMGFMDMYHSWWFMVLLMLFAANLLICSLDRFPAIWRIVNAPLRPLKDEQFRNMPIKNEFILNGAPEKNRDKIDTFFRSLGFKPREVSDESGRRQLFAHKGRYSRLGVYITHISIIVILAGAVIGIFFGFNGFLNLPEGQVYSIAFGSPALTNDEYQERSTILEALERGGSISRAASLLGVEEPRLTARMRAVGVEPLGFEVRCDDFEVTFYGQSDMPKEYTSHLTVLENGREVTSKWIEVNSPLKYKGYTFYQSSYSMMPNQADFLFKLRVTSLMSRKTEDISVKQGEAFTVPGSTMEARVEEFSPALSFDQSGRPFTYADMMNNPAVRLSLKSGDKERSKWIMKRYPNTWTVNESLVIQLVDIWGAQYTGLQVRKDPGVWIVYLGCIIMSVGLYIAFFMSHRRVWVRVTGEKGSTRVTLAANSHKNREAFERKIDRSISLLTEGGK